MNKYNMFLGLTIGGIFASALMLFIIPVTSYLRSIGSNSVLSDELVTLWAIFGVSALIFAIGLAGCIRYKTEKPRKPIATTNGTHMGGLPIPGSVMVAVKLYNDKITFEVYSNLMGTKRQEINLSLDKIVSVNKIVNFRETQMVSKSGTSTLINTNLTADGYIQDMLSIEYMDNDEKKQILISLPALSGATNFAKAFYRLKPKSCPNQPIEL